LLVASYCRSLLVVAARCAPAPAPAPRATATARLRKPSS
jgi:hypothetical protein